MTILSAALSLFAQAAPLADAVATSTVEGTPISGTQEALNAILAALAVTIVGVIGAGARAVIRWLNSKAAEQKDNALAGLALKGAALLTDAARVGATVAFETYTKEIRQRNAASSGKLTTGEAAEARRRALEAGKQALGTAGKEIVTKAFGDVDTALAQYLESALPDVKVPAQHRPR